MIRSGLVALLSLAAGAAGQTACGRSQGNADQDLGGLVVAAKTEDQKIDVALAVKDPVELGRALSRPYRAVIAALGPHTVSAATTNTVDGDGAGSAATRVSDLSDQTTLELGDAGAFHATYNNSADYGREAIFVNGQLYLRPRYQRWHQRAPEGPDEPATLRDEFMQATAAAWDLLAPGIELSDAGAATVAGRAGRKVIVKLSPSPRKPATEPLTQRKWRETRTVDAVSGEIVLDADSGLPLAVKLAGTVTFARDGRRFKMTLGASSTVDGIGKAVAIAAPAGDEVVATPERRREVDDRDYLLQNIAPPLRRNADGTAIAPQPVGMGGSAAAAMSGSGSGGGSGSGSGNGNGSGSGSSGGNGSGSGDPLKKKHRHHDDGSAGSAVTP